MELIKKLKEKRKKAIAKKLLKKNAPQMQGVIKNCIFELYKCKTSSEIYSLLVQSDLIDGLQWFVRKKYKFSIEILLNFSVNYLGGFGTFVATPNYFVKNYFHNPEKIKKEVIRSLEIQHNLIVLLTNI